MVQRGAVQRSKAKQAKRGRSAAKPGSAIPCRSQFGAAKQAVRFHDHYDRNGYCDNPGRGY
jgi:hypothetical protein